MSKQKLSFNDLKKIREALQILGTLNLPIAYEVAKNLKRVNATLREPEELLAELWNKYIDKDADGNQIQYTINGEAKIVVANKDELLPDARVFTKIGDSEKQKDFQEQKKKTESDTFEVDLHEVKMSKLKDYIEKNGIMGNALEPLLDVVLIEDETK